MPSTILANMTMTTTKYKCPFVKGKTYYEAAQDHQIKFIEEKLDHTYVFKIIGDEVWDELETRDISCIYENKTAYKQAAKTQQNQEVNNVMLDM